ncbi:serine hydrolase domain-containing protein [Lactiplantibacillus sp. WILCCON 0030]|uniref:Serine hydrolase domain-containing protein n=1 Tax=Lactiplantibacillus brownii TaxID=3069269 RepID=A0ABU1A7L8_9LACO|nr:serine hydrolase domain-containing protein [Lactiplantibacillus brownii]MDQ7936947.1 serine hydrolase domain-containing protein [Lactiplantibacillus brownii]
MKRQQLIIAAIVGGLLLAGISGVVFKQVATEKPIHRDTNRASIVVKKPQPAPKKAPKVVHHAGNYTKAQAIAKIDTLIKNGHIMGTLLITNNGPAGVVTRTYGYADVASAKLSSANEVYPLASLQKALTGAVVQCLINQGKLRMTTPLSKYFPQIPYAQNITVRDLLDHRSGIRMGEPAPTTVLPDEAAQIKFTVTHLTSTNNHAYAYSNANFTLLAGMIRRATGQSYLTNLKTFVLKPLGMRHTFAYNQIPVNTVDPEAYQLTSGDSRPVTISKALQSSELGCGSLYSSVGDYYKFINALLTGKLVGHAGFNELSAQQQLNYAAGIYYLGDGNIRIGGSDNSFNTYYMGTTSGKIGVVLFDNQGNFRGDNGIGYEIQAILAKSDLF